MSAPARRDIDVARSHRLRSLLIVGDAMALELERLNRGDAPTNPALADAWERCAESLRELEGEIES